MRSHGRIYAGIFLLSLTLLLFELTLIRIYSATLFYHFAFMAISVAMLGLSAAAITVHHRFRENIENSVPVARLAHKRDRIRDP